MICVWDSKFNVNAQEAVNTWHTVLVDRFGEGFGIEAMIVNSNTNVNDLEKCDIHIIYILDEYTTQEGLETKTGQLWKYNPSTDVFLFIYEERENRDPKLITATTLHELGHGFSLNHVIPESMGEAMRPWPDTLMWQWVDENYERDIDEQTLLAFKCYYNGGSWQARHMHTCPIFYPDFPRDESNNFFKQ